MKNMLRFFLSLALSALFLWLTFRHVDFALVWHSMRAVRLQYVAYYAASLALIQVFRSLRWEVLVRPFAHLNQRLSWRISNVGNMLVMLMPLRLGEFSRPYLMKRDAAASFVSTMAAVGVERVVDGLLVSFLFFATTAQLGEPYHVSAGLRGAAYAALGLFMGVTVVIALWLLGHGLVPRLLRRVGSTIAPTWVEKLIAVCESFVTGLRTLHDVRAVTWVVIYTLGYWAANGLGLYWLACAFGWSLPVLAGFTLVCVLVIGIMIPAGPGFLGTYQMAIILGLGIFGVSQSDAVAYSMVAYPINLAVVVAFGLPYLFGRGSLQVGDLVREGQASKQSAGLVAGSPRSTTY